MAKNSAAPASNDAPSDGTVLNGVPVTGKGRATPSRAEQEAARKRPLVPDTKEAKARARAELQAQRDKARVGMAAGDPRYLPARDQGAQRKFVRDYVDAGWHLGEAVMPAMVVVIGIHELASEALESGVVRIAYGLLRFAMLATGIAAAVAITQFATAAPHVTATALPWPVVLALVGLGGLALVVCLQGPRRDAIAIVAAALIAYGTQELTKQIMGERGAPMVSAFMLGAIAYIVLFVPVVVAGRWIETRFAWRRA